MPKETNWELRYGLTVTCNEPVAPDAVADIVTVPVELPSVADPADGVVMML